MSGKPGLRPDEIAVGAVVRLTGRFLRNTGQIAGSEGASRWKIVACECRLCRPSGDGFRCVAVDEPHEAQRDPRGYEDIPADERPKWRHINAANLELANKLVRPVNLPDAEPPLQRPFDRRRRCR